jgi:hypothetical protein
LAHGIPAIEDTDEQVLHAGELVAEFLQRCEGFGERITAVARQRDLTTAHLGIALHDAVQGLLHRGQVHVQLLQQERRNVGVHFQDALEQVAVLQHLLTVARSNGLGLLNGLLGADGEFVQVHGFDRLVIWSVRTSLMNDGALTK